MHRLSLSNASLEQTWKIIQHNIMCHCNINQFFIVCAPYLVVLLTLCQILLCFMQMINYFCCYLQMPTNKSAGGK